MKQFITLILVLIVISNQAIAQEKHNDNLLDGTFMDYYYQNGSAVHAEFLNGQFKFKWIEGPNKGEEGLEKYQSRKIGDKLYMISFMVVANSSFVTIVFNFNQNVISTSAIIAPKTENQIILFDEGIIKNLYLKEN